MPGAARGPGLRALHRRRSSRRFSIGEERRSTAGASGAEMRSVLTGRTGGMLVEALAGRRHRALGHRRQGRPACRSRSSSAAWGAARSTPTRRRSTGSTTPPSKPRSRARWPPGSGRSRSRSARRSPPRSTGSRQVRRLAGDAVGLSVDANWAYDVDDAIRVGRVLADLDYAWFEEPIRPEDRRGYRMLREKLPIRLAAGESDFSAARRRRTPRGPLDRPRPARRRAFGRHHRDLAHRRTRALLRRRLRAACRLVRRGLRGGKPAARGGRGKLHRRSSAWSTPTRCARRCSSSPWATRPRWSRAALPIPDGPGLGIELDREALAAYRIDG